MSDDNKPELKQENSPQKDTAGYSFKIKKEYAYYFLLMAVFGLTVIFAGPLLQKMFSGQSSAFKTVDLMKLSESFKSEAKEQALKEGVTDDERLQILKKYEAQMNAVQDAINTEAESCKCTILVKSAIVADATNIPDITDQIMEQIKKGE